jgi:hypothetical protein
VRRTESFDVDGATYSLTQFGAKQGQRWLVRLAKVFAPAFAHAASVTDTAALAAVLDAAASDLSPELFDELCADFARACVVNFDGKEVPLHSVYDDHFAGRYDALLKWLRECFKVNFSGFFSALQAASASPKASK